MERKSEMVTAEESSGSRDHRSEREEVVTEREGGRRSYAEQRELRPRE
jgi:hypothetical protein